MNPFIQQFKITKLIDYIQKLQLSTQDKKNSPNKRVRLRSELVEAQEVLKSKVEKLSYHYNITEWRNEAGAPVRVKATGTQGIIHPVVPSYDIDMLIVSLCIEKIGAYYPEELEFALPFDIYTVKLI